MDKKIKVKQLFDLLEDLRCDLYEIISVGEFEEVEIDRLFQKYKRILNEKNDIK